MSPARKADRLALPEEIWSPGNDSKEETGSWFPCVELQGRENLVWQRSVCPTEAELDRLVLPDKIWARRKII